MVRRNVLLPSSVQKNNLRKKITNSQAGCLPRTSNLARKCVHREDLTIVSDVMWRGVGSEGDAPQHGIRLMSHYYHLSNHTPWRQPLPCSVAICIHSVVVITHEATLRHKNTPRLPTLTLLFLMVVIIVMLVMCLSAHTRAHEHHQSGAAHTLNRARVASYSRTATACRYELPLHGTSSCQASTSLLLTLTCS